MPLRPVANQAPPPAALAPLPPSAWRLTPPQRLPRRLPGFSPCRPLPPLTWRFAPTPAAPASAAPPGGLAEGGGREGTRHAGGRVGGVFEGGCGCFWPFSLWFTQAGVPIGAKRQGLLSVFPGQWNWPIAARSFSSVKHSEIGQKLAMGRQVPHRMGLGRSLGAVASDGGRPHLLLEPPPPAFAMSWGPPASCPLSSACSAVIRASPEPPPPRFRRSPGVSPLPQCPPCPPAPSGGCRFGDGRGRALPCGASSVSLVAKLFSGRRRRLPARTERRPWREPSRR